MLVLHFYIPQRFESTADGGSVSCTSEATGAAAAAAAAAVAARRRRGRRLRLRKRRGARQAGVVALYHPAIR